MKSVRSTGSTAAVEVHGLGKAYRLGRRPGGLRGADRAGGAGDLFWALDDVTFSVEPGVVLGIIGANGAGKSTLFKVLSRITEPTRGHAVLRGAVSSLLEVGTGFHPDLTGRENVYLNGAILGMRTSDVRARFDQIAAFAQIDDFLDTPVKRYSSGMYVRLAFAVAAHLEPDVLLVDEVLAVGDAAFQRRCLGKIDEVAHAGRAVLFVSHNLTAVRSLCDSVLWLDHGRVRALGPSRDVIRAYLEHTDEGVGDGDHVRSTMAGPVELLSAEAVIDGGEPGAPLSVSHGTTLRFAYRVADPRLRLNLSLEVSTDDHQVVFVTTSVGEPAWHGRAFSAGDYVSEVALPGHLLNAGRFRARLLFVVDESNVVDCFDPVLRFQVHDDGAQRGAWHGEWPGVVRPELAWTTRATEPHRVPGNEVVP